MLLASLSHQAKSPVSLECFSYSQAHVNYVDTIVRVLAWYITSYLIMMTGPCLLGRRVKKVGDSWYMQMAN